MQNTLIDNSSEKLSMTSLLRRCISTEGLSEIKIATGYWDIPGMSMVVKELSSFLQKDGAKLKIVIGREMMVYANQVLSPLVDAKFPQEFMKQDIDRLSDNIKPEYQDVVRMLLTNCEQGKIEIHKYEKDEEGNPQFLHSKCYIFNGKSAEGEKFAYGIIGSSNFTEQGLTNFDKKKGNRELNYLETNKQIVNFNDSDDETCRGHNQWFDEIWTLSTPWTEEYLEQVIKPAKITVDLPKDDEPVSIAPLTPYELYIKLLQTKFGDLVDKNLGQVIESYLPHNEEKKIHYDAYEYQIDAVKQCFSTMHEYGGFLLADVVGLGKTVVGTLLIRHFIQTPDEDGRERKVLVITPPAIQSAWKRTIADFDAASDLKIGDYVEFITTGSIGHLVDDSEDEEDTGDFETELSFNNYGLIIVDESHKFRNSETRMYRTLDNLIAEIGSETGSYPYIGLLSATPQNNRPNDLKNQIYLFTRERANSKLKKAKGGNVESYFAEVNKEYETLIRKKKTTTDSDQYQPEEELSADERRIRLKGLSARLREDILDYVMVRRTRTDVKKYYSEDMEKQGMVFPDISGPHSLDYVMSPSLAQLFSDTMTMIVPRDAFNFDDPNYICYYRYRAIQFLKDAEKKQKYAARGSRDADTLAEQLAKIMQILLVKRLESSFSAFQQSLENLKHYTDNMRKMWENNTIFICPQIDVNAELDYKKKSQKKGVKITFQDCVEDVRRKIAKLNEEGRNVNGSNLEYTRDDFDPSYIELVNSDYEIIADLCERWGKNSEDPKLDEFKDALKHVLFNPETNHPQKLVIFSEAIDTVDAIIKAAEAKGYAGKVLRITAANRDEMEETIIANFDANYKGTWKDDYQIIVTTDVLAEGINLHRANVILNYDTPWNSTKLMQRIGRVNRIGSKEEKVYVYNFMPSAEGDQQIDLVNKAYTKLQSFHTLFGEDSKIFSETEEVAHYDLNTQVNGEESPLEKYIYELKEYKAAHPERYSEIEQATEGLQMAIDESGTGYFVVKAPRMVDFYVAVNPQNEDGGEVISLPEVIQKFKASPDVKAIDLPANWEAMQKEAVRVVIAELASVRQRQGSSTRATTAKGVINELKHSQAMSPESKKMLNAADALIRKGNPDMVNCILMIGEAIKAQNLLIPYTQEEFDEYLSQNLAKIVENVQLRNGVPEVKMAVYKA